MPENNINPPSLTEELQRLISENYSKVISGESWKAYTSKEKFVKDTAMIVLAPITLSLLSAIGIVGGLVKIAGNIIPALRRDPNSELAKGVEIFLAGIATVLIAAISPILRTYNIFMRSFYPQVSKDAQVSKEIPELKSDASLEDLRSWAPLVREKARKNYEDATGERIAAPLEADEDESLNRGADLSKNSDLKNLKSELKRVRTPSSSNTSGHENPEDDEQKLPRL